MTGIERTALIELSETYLVSIKTTTKTSRAKRVGRGAKARNAPRAVATPFPPLNWRKGEKQCPQIALNPSTAGSG